ncbi:MAG TPA: aminotransferase class V-fold PLP-dependent enzyme, partial [Candidatus Krumholzibacterium sp.]|nr:aminotransferase class V-fold PLP-dependent enzyme [Candidatus Krumholzibacterium sp.]
MTKSRDIYFDHNATTAARQEVVDAMLPWFREHFGNASSLHRPGQTARDAVEKARIEVAQLIGAEPEEILFTSGGTESDNIAVRGTLSVSAGRFPAPHIITSSIEHPAILRTCRMLEREGVEVTFLP